MNNTLIRCDLSIYDGESKSTYSGEEYLANLGTMD
jgi:hypothetical protein